MNRTCIVVADGKVARFYDIEEVDSPREKSMLVERAALDGSADLKAPGRSATARARTEIGANRQSGPAHPEGEQRERHRVELERRYGQEIVRQVGEISRDWKDGVVVLVAEPQLLGLIRESMRNALPRGVELKELAKDYTRLTAHELHDRLSLGRLVPARRSQA